MLINWPSFFGLRVGHLIMKCSVGYKTTYVNFYQVKAYVAGRVCLMLFNTLVWLRYEGSQNNQVVGE